MTTIQIVYLGGVFILVFGAMLGGMYLLTPSGTRQRVREIGAGGRAIEAKPNDWMEQIANISRPFAKLSLPEDDWENSPLRARFMNAGLRSPSAPYVFFGAKTILALVFPLAAYLCMAFSGLDLQSHAFMAVLLVAAAIGYYLPNIVLRRMIFVRQREIFETFPDALDLMTVCVESGLGIDAALSRVTDEMRHRSEVLCEELHLVTLELRAGGSKEKALRNLAIRTGVEDVDTLVAMLIQAERFGTSIADSLRVHADTLRTKRRFRAEEAAAKIALKLLFPLIFCIFPAMLLVLLGPAFIQIYRVLLPTMAGN
jgi:tight adherence protein C